MANRFLSKLYNLLYNEEFLYSNFDNRLKMQKGIYLLQEMGVPAGEYRFSWYKHGPYSQSLLDDMHSLNSDLGEITLAPDAERAVNELKDALKVPEASKYSPKDWAECLGSLHYLKENICSASSKDNDLFDELIKRKSHLQDEISNKIALSKI